MSLAVDVWGAESTWPSDQNLGEQILRRGWKEPQMTGVIGTFSRYSVHLSELSDGTFRAIGVHDNGTMKDFGTSSLSLGKALEAVQAYIKDRNYHSTPAYLDRVIPHEDGTFSYGFSDHPIIRNYTYEVTAMGDVKSYLVPRGVLRELSGESED